MSEHLEFHVIKADVNPTIAPPEIGVHWINVLTKATYFSVGTGSISDWVLQTSGVLSYDDFASFPVSGLSGVLYLAEDDGEIYTWNGSAYELTNNITDAQSVLLTNGGDTILHYHATDRDRDNHTGTQLSTTISNFDSAVESNVQVSANTAHRDIVAGNPHAVTKADVGLGDAENTSDLAKPISTATQTALDLKEDAFAKNTAFNKDFGTTAGTVAEGNHNHSGVYEPANANIQA
ncbi:MAG: hypothetical protein D3913_16345, partial [Candidatus Electrothrix sp. LOE1_4_5]|nr:hypothetical protein [Candidatus Electrothrix gigas]